MKECNREDMGLGCAMPKEHFEDSRPENCYGGRPFGLRYGIGKYLFFTGVVLLGFSVGLGYFETKIGDYFFGEDKTVNIRQESLREIPKDGGLILAANQN